MHPKSCYVAQPSPSQVPPGLQLLNIFITYGSNMIIVIIIYFLSLTSDRKSLILLGSYSIARYTILSY
jgi:hypothetical protein